MKDLHAGFERAGNRATPVPIAVVAYTEYPSDPRVRKEAETLRREGYEVDVISLRSGELPESGILNGVRVYELPLDRRRGNAARYAYQYLLFFALSSAFLFHLFLRHRYRAIHVHSLPDFQVLCALPEKLLGAKVVLDLHEAMPEILAARLDLPMEAPIVRIARFLEVASARYADSVIVVSSIRSDLMISRGLEPRKLVVVRNSPDLHEILEEDCDSIREQEGLQGRWTLVQAGGLNPERDLVTLVRAAGLLSTIHPTSLLLFGKGDAAYLQSLRQVAREEVPNLDFRIRGWLPQEAVTSYLRISDVGVVTYRKNQLTLFAAPNKVYEYVAVGRPLVLPDLPALRSEWRDAAVFYEPGDASDLAEKIRAVIERPDLRAAINAQADAYYRERRWDVSRTDLIRDFQSLLGERGD